MNYVMTKSGAAGIGLVYDEIVWFRDVFEKTNRDMVGTDEFYYYLEGLNKALEIIDDYDAEEKSKQNEEERRHKVMRYKLCGEGSMPPRYGSEGAAGIDIYYNGEEAVTIGPGALAELETHLAVEIPSGCFGMLVVRSGYGWRGLSMLNSVGIIDCDYRGEIGIKLVNHGHDVITIEPGVRVAQMIILPFKRVDLERAAGLGDTRRGTGGFGSTGVQ